MNGLGKRKFFQVSWIGIKSIAFMKSEMEKNG